MSNDLSRITRLSVFYMFFAKGFVAAAWVSRIPVTQLRLDLSEGRFGLVLLAAALGILTTLAVSGTLVQRFGSRRVIFGANLLMTIVLPLLAVVNSALLLAFMLFLFGVSMGGSDVANNTQAGTIERALQRPVMSAFHGGFSLGFLAGAALGSAMAGWGVPPLGHFVLAATIGGGIALALTPMLLQDAPEAGSTPAKALRLPPRVTWLLGLVASLAIIGETSVGDWSGIYLRDAAGARPSQQPLAVAAFSLSMTIGRFAGDALTAKLSRAALLRNAGLVAAGGLSLAVAVPQPAFVIAGYAVLGLGLSVVVPLTFSAATRLPDLPAGAGLAGVATLGYVGFLIGPPLIGAVADISSLRIAIAGVAFLFVLLAALGSSARVRRYLEL